MRTRTLHVWSLVSLGESCWKIREGKGREGRRIAVGKVERKGVGG